MKNIDAIFDYITNKITLSYIKNCINNNNYIGVDATEIENTFNIVRNNASTILNQLVKQDKLIKINSRPVSFFPKQILIDCNLINENESNIIYSLEKFRNCIYSINNPSINDNSTIKKDPFNQLIGSHSSLLTQIEQAKAALMYPPKGLHTLLLGESGVGKSTFALAMYQYAKINKKLDEKVYPIVSFNCSDYFNNPQLLLSQLFGHVKGSFTGANCDKDGLVSKANGGILFLDEVHRLPSDGQEMLFSLIDKGEYHRLGESNCTHKSNVMIIAATTEDPHKSLLSTFLRRIPVIITLPPFRKKSIQEKMEVIETLFYYECTNLNKEIKISPEVLKALALYPFKIGNIGQLKSEVKLICAKSFLNHLKNNSTITVEFKMLSEDIIDFVFSNSEIRNEDKSYLEMFKNYLVLSPGNYKIFHPEKINDNIYKKITYYVSKYKKSNLSKEEIDSKIDNIIKDHFKNMLNKINVKNINKTALYKIVPEEVVNTSIELISIAEKELHTSLNPKFIFAFAFHINSLLQRIREGEPVVNSNLLKARLSHPNEYNASKVLVKKISDKFGVIVPEDEKGFLSILLANNKIDTCTNSNIPIIILCHGNSTASSMADVANKLLNSDIIKAIDMPLDANIQDIYTKFKSTAVAVNKGHGILVAVDMGSLCNFGTNLEKETGIKVRTLCNISTLILLEALRKVMYNNEDLDTICDSLSSNSSSFTLKPIKKPKAILTLCVTGQGGGMIAKKILLDNLNEEYKKHIKILATNYSEVKNNIKSFTNKYHIIACVGSINPNLNVPYFPINKILNNSFKEEFTKFLDTKFEKDAFNKNGEKENSKSVYELSKEMLEEYLKFVNPKIAISNIKKFIIKLGLDDSYNNKNNIMDLMLHMGCMLDRCIHGDKVKFDNVENFKLNNLEKFMSIKTACTLLEKEYDICINDDEICYIVQVINR
ncbi:sigma 54-interacting transcriptional regulator [Haloimpatiens massiliensis]|uniref:sigma 54-interacting transcriptional regulator n=1 Tax=Haloimpatiens massiliensis TaxID=1658110 RepID=UPI000C832E5F|nr:sigma-54-dependent transcriptional regulator [Haloimpatiens massiliensis]